MRWHVCSLNSRMSNPSIRTIDAGGVRYNTSFITEPCLALFDPNTPSLQAQAVTQGGRNAAWFIEHNGQQAVLRHYKRGGIIAKVVQQYYVWTGANRTRSWAEFSVLLHLRHNQVAVPMPLAALWERAFLGYRAAIIVARIPAALPIAHQLENTCAEAVAFAVKKMHDAGVWHADLNVFNVLIDAQQQIHLIDFDKAKILSVVNSKQRQNNVLRLRRSLIKVRGEIGLRWFEQFNHAYQQLNY